MKLSIKFLLITILFLFCFEPLSDKAHRSLLLHYTSVPKEVVKALRFHLSDLFVSGFFAFMLFFSWSKIKNFLLSRDKRLFFGLVLSMFFSLAMTTYSTTLWSWIQLSHWFSIFFFWVVFDWLQSKCSLKELMSFLCIVLFCIGVFEAIAALGQYFSQGAIGLRLLGEPKLNSPTTVRASLSMSNYCLTSIDYFFSKGSGSLMRAYGTFSHPNALAGFLSVGILSSLPLYLQRKSGWLFLGMSMQIAALFVTFSRAAFIATTVAGIIWFYLQRRRNVKPLFFRLFLVISSFFILFFPQITARGGVKNFIAPSFSAERERVEALKGAISITHEAGLFGSGLGNFMKTLRASGNRSIVVHNIYLFFFIEQGIVGIGLLLFWIFYHLKVGFHLRRESFAATWLSIFVAFLMIGFLDFYPLFFHQLRFFFFLSPILLSVIAKREEELLFEIDQIEENMAQG